MTSPGLFIDGYIPAEYSSALTTVKANDVPYWRSLSRPMSSTKWEILKINFRQAVLITDISFDTLRISHNYQVYYTNRNGLLIPVVLNDNSFFEGAILTGEDIIANGASADLTLDISWEKVKRKLYPIVAKSLEIRMQRVPDSQLTTDSTYRLGIRKLTLKRTIATEQNKYLGITDSIDSVGNFVSKTFLDWEPQKAYDGLESTFWKSSPQPSPNAVVSFYLDTRNVNGDPSPVDKVYIDPVYSGQQINLYTSNDDTEILSTLSTVAIAPTTQTNVNWQQNIGIILTDAAADLRYDGTRTNMVSGENFWLALAFNLSFDSSATVGSNLTLFSWDNVSIVYNDSTKKITFTAGSLSATTGTLSFSAGDRMIFIFQVRSLTDPDPAIEAYVYHGAAQASHVITRGNTGSINFTQAIRFRYSDGNLTQAVIKRGAPTATDISQFVASPETYVSPDPVINNGDHVTSTTLDYAIFGGNFTASPLVFAGSSFHRFSGKTWSPVWANYTSVKGYLVLPQQVNVKYIKLEFTKLTPEPYPIVDPDIEVSYREFPITFSRDQIFTSNAYTATSLDSRMGVETQIDPNSVADKYGLNYGPLDTVSVKDVQIQVGDAVYTNVPHTYDQPVTNVTNVEPASSQVLLNTTEPQSMTVVQAQNYTVVKGDTLIGIAARYGIPDWHTILDLNVDLLNANLDRAVAAGYPRHTAGWWIFPGQQLRISTAQTQEWTVTTTVTEATTKSTVNNKFTITSVHEYDTKTVKRDAAIAYFAGLKEVAAYREDFTVAADSQVFEDTQFQISDITTYSMNNVSIQNSNSVTNLIKNPNFALGLQGFNDAVGLGAGSYDALASFVLSNDFAFGGTLSCKLTYGSTTGKPQGLFVRLNNLPPNQYVGLTYRTYTVASGTWTLNTHVYQANGNGQVDLLMVSAGAPTPGNIIYIDAVGAYLVNAANSTVPNFFDGDFAGSQWNGYQGQSSSVTTLDDGPGGSYTSVYAVNPSGRMSYAAPYTTSFESGVAGWTPTNATFASSTASIHTGGKSGLLTVVGSPASASVQPANQSVIPTEKYLASCWVYSSDASPASAAININWYDSGSTFISTTSGTAAVPATGTWEYRQVLGTAPVNAAYGVPVPILPSTPATGKTLYVDDVSFGLLGDVSQVTNLVSNPCFETSTAGWASGGTGYDTVTSIAVDNTQKYYGTQAMKITWKTYTTKQGVTFALTGLVNGQTYTATAMVFNKAANTTECFLECGGATGYTSNNLLRGGWQKLQVRWTQSGTTATLALATTAATNNDVTWIDTVAVFAIPTLYSQAPDYFDGSVFGDSWTGTVNLSTSQTPAKGVLQTPQYNTWSQFRKITATMRAKPLDTILSGLNGATALGVGTNSLATWEDPLATWADSTAAWGAASALATINFVSDYVYNGVHSIWIHRGSSGIGGVYSAPVTPMVGAHVRAEITVFLPSSLNVTSVVKIVDAATKSTVYLQETITSPRGGWQTYVTNFIVSDGTQICIDIESNGNVASDLYIADMSLKMTTITMYASNDGWGTQLDLNDLVWKTNNICGSFLYGGNRIQVKFEMLRVGDWISGFSVTPYYLS